MSNPQTPNNNYEACKQQYASEIVDKQVEPLARAAAERQATEKTQWALTNWIYDQFHDDSAADLERKVAAARADANASVPAAEHCSLLPPSVPGNKSGRKL